MSIPVPAPLPSHGFITRTRGPSIEFWNPLRASWQGDMPERPYKDIHVASASLTRMTNKGHPEFPPNMVGVPGPLIGCMTRAAAQEIITRRTPA